MEYSVEELDGKLNKLISMLCKDENVKKTIKNKVKIRKKRDDLIITPSSVVSRLFSVRQTFPENI